MVKRKNRHTRRKRQKGGFWNPFSSEPDDPYAPKSGFFSNIGSYFSSATDKANTGLGNAASGITGSVTSTLSSLNPFSSSSSSSTPSSYSSPSSSSSSYSSPSSTSTSYASPSSEIASQSTGQVSSSYGGRSKRKAMRGGKGGLGLTYYATDVANSGLKVAEPTYWIKGGSKRRRTRKIRKSRKHRKH